jgi:CubicO group peptidase (beta-lactamase class C family)
MRLSKGLAIGLIASAVSRAEAQDRVDPGTTPAPEPSAQAALSVSAPSPVRHELTKADLDVWLDGYIPYALHTADIPGMVVTVVKDGEILTARGFGYADAEKRVPVDPDTTLFRPGSISKLFTWTAVMQLVEQHELELDRDINSYLDFTIPPFDGQPMNLRQLMTHTGGFEETAKGIIAYDPKFELPLRDYLVRWIPNRIFAPGTTPAYSNYGTALAGYIVQRASGEEFAAYVDTHIFAPLGMRTSTMRQPLPANLADQLAIGDAKPGQKAPGFEIVGPGPAGAAANSGTDMARFMIAHLQDGQLNGNRILAADTAEIMHDSPLGPVDPTSIIPPLNRMELGFFETNINGREVIGHLGDTEVFHSSLHLFLKEGVGLFLSLSSRGKAGGSNTLRGALFQDFADRYFPDTAPADDVVDPKLSAEHARMMSGLWWASRRAESSFLSLAYVIGQTAVYVGPKGELVIPSLLGPNDRPREWVEIAPFVWRDKNGHDRLAAKLADGAVVRWAFDFVSPFEMFDRVPADKSRVWILPGIYLAIGVLLLSFLHWPVAWFVRRRYRAEHGLTVPALRAHRAMRLLAGLSILLVAVWAIAITSLFGSPDALAGGFDPILWSLQLAGLIIFVAAVLASFWHLSLSVRDGRHWTRGLWNGLVFLSTAMLLYVAFRFGLVALSVQY